MIIDFHIHYCPEKFVRPNLGPGDTVRSLISAKGDAGDCAGPLRYNLPKFIEMMDQAGVDVAVLSSGAGMRRDLEDSYYVNNMMKEAEEKYPGRLKGTAHVPPLGGKEAFQELKRCKEELGFCGVAMHSVVGGKDVDDRQLWPFYEKVSELGMFLFIHPAGAGAYSNYLDYDLGRSVAREGHLATVVVRLINGGVLDDFPDLKIVMSHLGGHFAACMSRIELYQDKEFWGIAHHPRHSRKCQKPFRSYLNKMYFDTGGIVGDINPVKMALMELNPRNILFGTDYPLEIREGDTVKKFIEKIKSLPLGNEEIQGILAENGRSLIGI
ncbi:MAG: amidohydrolase family protein [Peptococcaceae bacterium]